VGGGGAAFWPLLPLYFFSTSECCICRYTCRDAGLPAPPPAPPHGEGGARLAWQEPRLHRLHQVGRTDSYEETGVVDPHGFHCGSGSGSSTLGQCGSGSRVVMTKNCKFSNWVGLALPGKNHASTDYTR
jgi:hypothetical protein